MDAQGQAPIGVYVRKGPIEDTRVVSFKRPEPNKFQNDALRRGFAIDGNSISYLVTVHTRVGYTESGCIEEGLPRTFLVEESDDQPLLYRLHQVECLIRDWLAEYKYDVVFL